MGRLLLVLAIWLAGSGLCQAAARTPLIVVSLDGFRNEYLERGLSPTLTALALEGVRAVAMRPSFPSVTEPNHYTLMTGLYPDHHGIVDNTMIDPAMPGIAFGGPHGELADRDPRWWDEATPLWVTAERAGVKTATSLWPGEEAVIHGVAPTYVMAHPQPRPLAYPMDKQVDSVLGWLDLPADKRPGLIRLHLDLVDTMGHLYGPDGPEVNGAIAKVDAALGRLIEGLKRRGLLDAVNLVIVSDHGMTGVSQDRVIYLDRLIDMRQASITSEWAASGVHPEPGYRAAAEAILLAPHAHMRCWRKAEIPAHLHYGSNRRVPEILCLADLGWTITTAELQKRYPKLLGNHGYDPAEPSMAAIFLAHGPAFRSGVTLPAFDNVDVYPMLAHVMALKTEPNDGRLGDLEPALAR